MNNDWGWVPDMRKAVQKIFNDNSLTDPNIRELNTINAEKAKNTQAVAFELVERAKYFGEVGKKDGDFIYHFYPKFSFIDEPFVEAVSDACIAVFKKKEVLFGAVIPEMNSYGVKVVGYAANPLADSLAAKVFDELDKRLS